ncbi:MAG: hypothetical protein ACJAZP_002306 [Psychromonas sp.]|uniref:hypothetical protein n=1 Tax=Psychromonas sp. TaxID=1884585 RepID=UPI0039E2E1F3
MKYPTKFSTNKIDLTLLGKGASMTWMLYFAGCYLYVLALTNWAIIFISLLLIFLSFLSFKSDDEILVLIKHDQSYKLHTLITYLLPLIASLLFGYELVSLLVTGILMLVNIVISLYWACFLTPKVFKENYTKLFGCIDA